MRFESPILGGSDVDSTTPPFLGLREVGLLGDGEEPDVSSFVVGSWIVPSRYPFAPFRHATRVTWSLKAI